MAFIHVFLQMPYRQMEGFTQKLLIFIPFLVSADYTALFCRIKRLDFSLPVDPTIYLDEEGFEIVFWIQTPHFSGQRSSTHQTDHNNDRFSP